MRLLGGEADSRLVELVRAGDERAFEVVVVRYTRPLRSDCRRLGLSPSRAEDAVQQAFLSAWLALRRGDQVRDLGAWLRRIAHNKAVNIMRAPIEATGDGENIGHGANATDASPIEDTLAVRQALSDIAALPPRQRDVLLMSAVDGRSYEEVARALGISQGAVRGLLHRARMSLRDAAASIAGLPLLRWVSWSRDSATGPALGLAGAAGDPAGTGASLARCLAAGATSLAVLAGAAVGPLSHLLSSPSSSGSASSRRAQPTPAIPRGHEIGAGTKSAAVLKRTARPGGATSVAGARTVSVLSPPARSHGGAGHGVPHFDESGVPEGVAPGTGATPVGGSPQASVPAQASSVPVTGSPPPAGEPAPSTPTVPAEATKPPEAPSKEPLDDGGLKPGETDDGLEHHPEPPPAEGAPPPKKRDS